MKPRIGIPARRVEPNEGDPRTFQGLAQYYIRAIQNAGGVPIILPLGLDPADWAGLFECLHGVVLPGGEDVDPRCYGQMANPETGRPDADRDSLESWLVAEAQRAKLPILGICRGLQILNVALGGTLIQHLEAAGQTAVQHTNRGPGAGFRLEHEVRFDAGSRLRGLLGVDSAMVNSTHHQAVDRLGSGLKAVGRASDGVIEAVESTEGSFCMAVQFHPELLVTLAEQKPWQGLFGGFVAEAANVAQEAGRARSPLS